METAARGQGLEEHVIKVIRFGRRDPAVPLDVAARNWRRVVAEEAMAAPAATRPARVTLATALPSLTLAPDASGAAGVAGASEHHHDFVAITCFPDLDSLERFQAWLEGTGGRGQVGALGEVTAPGSVVTVVADERVVRGADWLAAHRRGGGTAFRHLTLARRAAGLTPAEFSRRWGAHAGQVRPVGTAAPTVIPASVWGAAYVQNHPRPRAVGEWTYDAVNEVYFETFEGLRERAQWFRAHPPDGSGVDIFGPSTFLAVREQVLTASGVRPGPGRGRR